MPSNTTAAPLTDSSSSATTNYVERAIDLTITLQQAQDAAPGAAAPTFSGTSSNVVKVAGGGPAANNGLRISANVTKAGGNSFGTAVVKIYNLQLDIMNKLSTLGTPLLYQVGKNTISIEAGDAINGMSVVFQGTITEAWAEFDSDGDAIFNISASVEAYNSSAAAQANTFPSSVAVATLMASLAQQAGYNFQNNGVTGQLPPMYLHGSVNAQIIAAADAAKINFHLDDTTTPTTLTIWPNGASRNGPVPLISAQTGMILSPRYTASGIAFQSLFNPSIQFGQKVQIQSILTPACGTFIVIYVDYDLEVQEPDGPWFMNVEATISKYFGLAGMLPAG